jgi:serine/threonine protein kinase
MEGKKILRTSNISKTYKIIAEVGSGTYGRVYKSKCLKTQEYVALKKIDMSKQSYEGFPITAIREIKLLQLLDHQNVIQLKEIVMTKPSPSNRYVGSVYLVFEYMEHDFVGLN